MNTYIIIIAIIGKITKRFILPWRPKLNKYILPRQMWITISGCHDVGSS